MTKNILKEIIIILLLTLAIILLIGVLLYDYVPMNKVIPEKVKYTASEEVKQISTELNEKKEEIPITSYTVTSTDLNDYKKVKEYIPGRKNPFGTIEEQVENNKETSGQGETTNATTNTTTNTTTNKKNNNTTNNKETTNYWPDKQIK